MEEEVSKHIKNIYRSAKDPKHSFSEKLKEVLIEVFIIVFAVTLSIWLHSWSEHRHEQQVAREFLKGLKSDLAQDIKMIEKNKSTASRLAANYDTLLTLTRDQSASAHEDSLMYHFEAELVMTRPNVGRYEGFKSSGKMETIENDSLKQKILVFYQQSMPNLAAGENFVNSLQLKILDLIFDRNEKLAIRELISTYKMKSMLSLGSGNFKNNITDYDAAVSDAKQIMTAIDGSMNE